MAASDDSTKSQPVQDYLEVDDPIPGQSYVCMSFVSPEEVIADRNLFFMNAFLKTIAKNYDLDEDTIQEKYKDFLFINETKLDDEYSKKHDFKTSVRGLKIRGTYDTLPEAQRRAKILQKTDPNFNVFVGQVGYWLPWDPAPHRVAKQEYAEKELNELIHKYEENQEARKVAFNKRVEREMEAAKQKNEETKKANAALKKQLEDEAASAAAASGGGAAADATDAPSSGAGADTQDENVLDQVMAQQDAWSAQQDLKNKSSDDSKDTDGSA